jgi:hypothetical protein
VDWARTGINRAVIDKRIKNETLFDLARNVLIPRPVVTKFLYPSYGGFGTYCDRLADRVRDDIAFLLDQMGGITTGTPLDLLPLGGLGGGR